MTGIRPLERSLIDELARRAVGHCEVDSFGREVKCTTEWLASFMEQAIAYGREQERQALIQARWDGMLAFAPSATPAQLSRIPPFEWPKDKP
jgi:hypothetical protein